MNKATIREKVIEDLYKELGREPMEEEIKIMEEVYSNPENNNFIVGLYRRFSNKKLQQAISKKGYTAKDIKKLSGIPENVLSKIINFRHLPAEEQKVKLAIALEIPVEDIFPEKYEELYEKISPLPLKGEIQVDILRLGSAEVLKLEAPTDYFNEAEKKAEFDNRIKPFFEYLTPREQMILSLRFGFKDGVPHSLEETAMEFGVNRERIRQIETKALEKIREAYYLKPNDLSKSI